jgi:hypothetical protein
MATLVSCVSVRGGDVPATRRDVVVVVAVAFDVVDTPAVDAVLDIVVETGVAATGDSAAAGVDNDVLFDGVKRAGAREGDPRPPAGDGTALRAGAAKPPRGIGELKFIVDCVVRVAVIVLEWC